MLENLSVERIEEILIVLGNFARVGLSLAVYFLTILAIIITLRVVFNINLVKVFRKLVA